MSMSGPAMMKRREKFKVLIEKFPEREEFYLEQIEQLTSELKKIKACQRCGRPLRGEESQARGYGPECAQKSEVKEKLEHENDE